MRIFAAALLAGFVCGGGVAQAQWDLEESHSTASLRGVFNVGSGVAWASGSGGTVLRTEDGGYLWQVCTVPPGGKTLDFRGVVAFDANTAVVMASGKGSQSALFRTTDGCQTWKKVYDNPDANGFFDSIHAATSHQLYVLGDPVEGGFRTFYSPDQGVSWFLSDEPGLQAPKEAGAFAASNSSLAHIGPTLYFGTGGTARPRVYRMEAVCEKGKESCPVRWASSDVPMAGGVPEAGIFSLAGTMSGGMSGKMATILVAVGGVYNQPAERTGTAAYSRDGGVTWSPAATLPGGFRSAVGRLPELGAWIAVGPNGTDVSFDDGRNWKALQGPGADGWNAVSPPFAVGAKGRIGRLQEKAVRR